MLTRLFLLSSFMLPHLIGASDCHPDSLRAVAQAMEASSSKIEVLYDLSVCYNFGSLDSSLHYIEEAVALSRSLNDRAWLCRCNSRYGLELAKQARYPEAEAAFLKGKGHCNTDIELAKLYNNRAIFYGMANRLVEGKRELLKGLNINRKSGNRDGEAKSMMNLAINHMRLSEHTEALDYAHRALSINDSLRKPVNLGINLSMLSSIYMELEDVDNAVRYLEQAIPYFRQQNMTARLGYATFNRASLLNDQNKGAEAITAYLEAAAILEDINDQRALGTVYLELGDLYQKRNQFEEALDIIEPNIERTRASQNYPDLVQTIATRGLVRAKQGAYRVAYADAEESLRIAKEQRLLKDQQQPYELFILLDSLTGNYRQGLIHLKSYMALNDSVLGLAETEKIAEMKTRLETSEKEKAILLLESDNLRKDELALAQRKRLSWGVAGLGGLILLAAYLFWQRSRLRRTQSALESSLRDKDVLLREIHHRVKNNLQLIMSLLNLQATEDQEQTVQDFLYKGQHRVRAIALIHEQLYRSDQLELIDLGTYTEDLVSSIRETHGMEHINYTINTEKTFLDIDKAVPLGIIINELVTNSLKHAFEGMDTGKISVSLHEERDELRLRVHDDGIGFPDQPANNSLGLELVRLLVKQLRGSLEIDGSRGTSISIQIAK